jgi:HSP20 family protein
MAIAKHDPFPEMEFPGLRLFQDAVGRLLSEPASRPWVPAVDILETENELVLRADLPGVDMSNVEIQVENSTLTLKGERRFEKTDKQGYHRIERNFGAFARYFSLPDTVDSEKVRADYRSGVLTITLPKKEVAKPRSVRIEVGNN